MTLPTPSLDDRSFQDIVDEAKRRIPRLCPDWTDHNVSDPGVALIELFAWMTEMILYRVNQVPDRLYVKFLELIGVELYTAASAATDVLFELSAPQETVVRIPAGIQVSTERAGAEDPVVFMTDRDLDVIPPQLIGCLTRADGRYEDHWDDLRHAADQVRCFRNLLPGDAFYLGFETGLASNLVRLHVVTGVEGEGADPNHPPYVWEAWTGEAWVAARVLGDTSLALNTSQGGDVTLLLPAHHEPLPIGQSRAHWLRCKLRAAPEGGPTYRQSPELHSVDVVSLGGAVPGHHADVAPPEMLGLSDGSPGQAFSVRRLPVLARAAGETVRVLAPRGAEAVEEAVGESWTEVTHFAEAGPEDRVFTWSGATGEIRFGPQITDRSGRTHQHGTIPPVDARIETTSYRSGGGRRGNVGQGKLTVLRTAVPFVASVRNLDPAAGGVDAETVQNAKIRGPLTLRSADRAVTVADFERLTAEAAPSVARARCLPPSGSDPARVLVVPRVDISAQSLTLDDLALPRELVERVAGYLDDRRLLTTRVRIDEPSYQGVMVVAEVRAADGMRPESVRELAERALYEHINPLTGGTDARGLAFGLTLVSGDVHALLQSVSGVAGVDSVYFFTADLRSGEVRDETAQRISLPEDALFMSFQHRVVVRQ